MSRRGNSHDNNVAESFFSLVNTERSKRKIFKSETNHELIYPIILSVSITQLVVMEIVVEYRPWILKYSVFASYRMSRKPGSCHNPTRNYLVSNASA
jgi:transposase InsO family protein